MSDEAHAELIEWGKIAVLLQAGAYEDAAARLGEVQLADQQTNDSITTAVVAAIRQLCLACHECQRAIAAHQQAIQENSQREAELRHHAQMMLAQITGASTVALMTNPTAISYPLPLHAAPTVSLWARIQRWASQFWQHFDLPSATQPAPTPTAVLSTRSVVIAEAPLEAVTVTMVETTSAADPAHSGTALIRLPTDETDAAVVEAALPAAVEAVALPPEQETIPALDEESSEPPLLAPIAAPAMTLTAAPSLVIYCLGNFRVYQNEQLIDVWPSGKGQLIFKYLLLNRTRPVAKEVLMDRFWPDAPPEAARNNLNVAIYGLRRALRRHQIDFSHVLFQNDCYLLNPDMAIWLDVEEFTQQLGVAQQFKQAGQQEQLIESYRAAEALYQGELLAEDRYEDWLTPQRQRLQDDYLKLLDYLSHYYLEQQAYELCAIMCHKLLAVDPCQEDAHRRLMDCFNRQGQPHLALRQYHRCVELLARELDVGPSPPTQELYARIRKQ